MSQLLSTVLTGAVVGSLFALLAFGIVLTYRTTGIFNFAQGALAMLFAFVFFQLLQGGPVSFVFVTVDSGLTLPTWLALVLVVFVLAPLVGWGLDRMMFRRLRTSETHVQMVSTIGLLIAIQGLTILIWSGQPSLLTREIFPVQGVEFAGVRTSSSFLWTIVVTVALSLGLMAFLRFSSLGVRMRAVVDRLDLAELVGIDSGRITALAWGASTALAAIAGILIAPIQGASLSPTTLPLILILPAIAAAVVGRLQSLPLTLAGGMLIGVGQTLAQVYVGQPVGPVLQASLPFLVLFGALLLPVDWREVRPDVTTRDTVVHEAAAPSRRRRIGYAVTAVVLLVLPLDLGFPPFSFFAQHQTEFATVPAIAIIFLGLVALVGYAGQISLAHGALAAIGAIASAHLVADLHVPFLLAVLLGGLVAVAPGVLLAFRAVRLSPLFLGLATLAFAALTTELMNNVDPVTNRGQGVFFSRTAVLDSPYTYYVAGLALFGLLSLLLLNVRRGTTGLALNAMRDSETAIRGFGTSLTRLKVTVFAFSSFLAGVGGALLGGALERVEPLTFQTPFSLIFLALAVVGGIRYARGALIGAALFVLSPSILNWLNQTASANLPIELRNIDALPTLLFGVAAIGLANNPGGIVEQAHEGWVRTFGDAPRPAPRPAEDPSDGTLDDAEDTLILERI